MALVLTRKLGEVVRIGPNVYVRVVDIDRGRVRLAIEAPAGVEIWRQEIDPRNQPAARPAPPPAEPPAYGRVLLNEIDAD